MAMNYNYRRNVNMPESRNGMNSEQQKMLNDIGMISLVLVDMTEYLDTHPEDSEAIDYFNYYSALKNQMTKEYSEKYTPLSLSTVSNTSKKWDWALDAPLWKGMGN